MRAYDPLVSHLISNHQYAEAASLLEPKLEGIRDSGDKHDLMGALRNLGVCYLETGRVGDARTCLEESLSLARSADAKREVAVSLHELSQVTWREGNLAEAIRLCQESIGLLLDLNEEATLEWRTLSVYYQEAGRYEEAMEILQNIRESCEARQDFVGLGRCLNEMGLTALQLGDPQRAVDLMVESIELKMRIGDARGIELTRRNLVVCLTRHPELLKSTAVQTTLNRLRIGQND